MNQFFGFTPSDSRLIYNEVGIRRNLIRLLIDGQVKSPSLLTGFT